MYVLNLEIGNPRAKMGTFIEVSGQITSNAQWK